MDFAPSDIKDEIEKEVYSYYLSRAFSLLLLATEKINDVEQLKQTFQTFAVISALTAGQRTMQTDATTVNLMEGLSNKCVSFEINSS